MNHLFGAVVLVPFPFPFSDQQGIKRRPAVIISSAAYNLERRDVLIMAITSRLRTPPDFGELPVNDWESAGLIKPSVFKPVLTTIE